MDQLIKTEFSITKPNFITKFYFEMIYKTIIKVGGFNEDKVILDFGCGYGYLKRLNKKIGNKSQIINYDIVDELSDIKDIFSVNFDKIVFCQSLYLIEEDEIIRILKKLREKNSKLEIIVVISKQSYLNKLLSILLFHWKFYKSVKTKPDNEEKILTDYCEILTQRDLILSKLLKLKFK